MINHSIRSLLFAEGEALMRASRADDAAAAFEKALKEAGNLPSAPTIAMALAGAYREAKPEYALRILLSYASADAAHSRALLERAGDILEPDTASLTAPLLGSEWRWLTDDEPEHTVFWRLLFAADVYASASDHARAGATLQRACLVAADRAQREKVGNRLYALAKQLNVANQLDAAAAVLRDAVKLEEGELRAPWLLSEVLRRRSYPENDVALVEQGLAVGEASIREAARLWTEAAAKAELIEPWALSSRAMLNEQLAKLPGADRWSLGWEAAVYALRAMLARGFDYADDHSTLARCYRALGLSACERAFARHATDIASGEDETRAASEERLIAAANAGDYDQALRIIGELGQSPWTDAVKAFVRVRQGAPAEALELIDAAIGAKYQETWCFDVRLRCLRDMGDHRAWQAYETAWADTGRRDDEALLRRGRAGVFLALRSRDFDAVAAVVEEYTKQLNLPTDNNAEELPGLMALAQGDAPAALARFQRSIGLTRSRRELDDLRQDVQFIAAHLPDAARPAPSAIEELIAARQAELADMADAPERELEELSMARPATDAEGWLRVAAPLTLAQFDAWRDNHEGAAARYIQALQQWPEKVPEARRALDECAKQLLGDADSNVATEEAAESRVGLRVHEWLTGQPLVNNDIRGDAWTALLCAHVLTGEVESARSAFHAAMRAYGESDSPSSPSWRLGARLVGLIRHACDYWKIWDAVVTIVPVAFDRAEIEEQLVTWFGAVSSAQPTRNELEWLPIILELGDGLIPENAAATYQDWALFRTYIPELRGWFVTHYGVPIGSIRVRGSNNLAPSQYAILIDEVPVALEHDTVRLEASFVTAQMRDLLDAGVRPDAIEVTKHPLTGKPAYWVTGSYEQLVAAGLQPQEPLQFVVEHLRQVLRRRLHEFIGPDTVDALVSEQCLTAEQQALAHEVLPTVSARFRFSRLLRALVLEGVPVWKVPEILHAIRGVHLYPTARDAAIKAVRLQLRSRLPGNDDGWQRIVVPPGVESGIIHAVAHPDDGAAAARIESQVSGLLAAGMDDHPSGVALTTARYETAAFLRAFLHRETWNVTALCQQELYEPAATTLSAVAP